MMIAEYVKTLSEDELIDFLCFISYPDYDFNTDYKTIRFNYMRDFLSSDFDRKISGSLNDAKENAIFKEENKDERYTVLR